MSSGSPRSVPTRIGKYHILRHLKAGGMATVYKAEDTDSGRIVALKILNPESAVQNKRLERFSANASRAPASSTRTSSGFTNPVKLTANTTWRWSSSTASTSRRSCACTDRSPPTTRAAS